MKMGQRYRIRRILTVKGIISASPTGPPMPDNGQIVRPNQISGGRGIPETIQAKNWTTRGAALAVLSDLIPDLGVPIHASLPAHFGRLFQPCFGPRI